jgi:Dirigent-like protein
MHDRFKGSSLQVQGAWDLNLPIEWAVVGGTGQFTFAQGIVYGKKLSEDNGHRIVELTMHIAYSPVREENINRPLTWLSTLFPPTWLSTLSPPHCVLAIIICLLIKKI